MELFQCFVCYLLGFGILIVLNSFFKTSEKLYYRTVISSAIGGVFLFIFAVVGYKFALIDGLASFIVGVGGVFGLILTVVFNLIF